MELNPETTALLVGLFGGAGTFLIQKLYKALRERNAMTDAISVAGEIVGLMQDFNDSVSGQKTLLLYTSNGGGIPHPGRPIYLTILYEVYRMGHSIRSMFERAPVNAEYIRLIGKLLTDGHAWHTPDGTSGFLDSLYFSEGVSQDYVVPVLRTRDRFYYLSVRWTEPPTDRTNVELKAGAVAREIAKLLS